jgi:hypothetical protein
VAGDGDAAELVRAAADRARGCASLEVVLLGDVPDPRDVYDAADVAFGMGSSALRALAHGKPVVVQGRDGFWMPFRPETADLFLAQGFFGVGDTGQGIAQEIDALRDPARRAPLAEFGRAFVVGRFALDRAVHVLEDLYRDQLEHPQPPRRRSVAHVVVRFLRYRVALAAPWAPRVYRRVMGRQA